MVASGGHINSERASAIDKPRLLRHLCHNAANVSCVSHPTNQQTLGFRTPNAIHVLSHPTIPSDPKTPVPKSTGKLAPGAEPRSIKVQAIHAADAEYAQARDEGHSLVDSQVRVHLAG